MARVLRSSRMSTRGSGSDVAPDPTDAAARRHHLRGHVGAGHPARCGEPGAGFPDTDGPRRTAGRRDPGDPRGPRQPVPTRAWPAELRQAIASTRAGSTVWNSDWRDEVVVATGASEVIGAAVLALADPGSQVALFDPYFDLYPAVIALAGASRLSAPLAGPALRPDIDTLVVAQLTPRTRVLLLNSPHNPTGIVLTPTSCSGWQGRDPARPGRDLRRGLRTPVVRRPPAHPDRHPARNGGAHHHHRVRRARRSRTPAGRSVGRPDRRT